MPNSVYVLAGQSNANVLRDDFSQALSGLIPFNRYVYRTAADPGAPLTWARGQDKQDWRTDSELPMALLGQVIEALEANPEARLGGIVWVQGEADTLQIARSENYARDLCDLFDWIKESLADHFDGRDIGLENFELVISGLSRHAPDALGRENWDEIRAQQYMAAQQDHIRWVDPDVVAELNGYDPRAMFRDGLHYSDAFAEILAQSLANTIDDRRSGDVFSGLSGHDVLQGSHLNDTLVGGEGADQLIGGDGHDDYFISDGNDRVIETQGGGHDHVYAETSFALRSHSQHIENLTLLEGGNWAGTGNVMNNVVQGNDGHNRLNGAWGDDTLRGGDGNDLFADNAGADVMFGGQGNDIYLVDDHADRVREYDSEGRDRVIASVSFSLRDHSQHIEQLRLIGREDLNATGNGTNNLIRGNAGDNRLDGAWGQDTLFGGAGDDVFDDAAGDDRFIGGAGADVFVFDRGDGNDVILDFENDRDVMRFDSGADRFSDLDIRQSGAHTVISYEQGRIVLTGVDSDQIEASDFLFA